MKHVPLTFVLILGVICTECGATVNCLAWITLPSRWYAPPKHGYFKCIMTRSHIVLRLALLMILMNVIHPEVLVLSIICFTPWNAMGFSLYSTNQQNAGFNALILATVCCCKYSYFMTNGCAHNQMLGLYTVLCRYTVCKSNFRRDYIYQLGLSPFAWKGVSSRGGASTPILFF